MALQNGDLILFQGDSITDCGRNREDGNDIGSGYPRMVRDALSVLRPDKTLRFLNRGISGNKTSDLLARWEEDCLALRPAFVSLLVGINDVWNRYGDGGNTDAKIEQNYTEILSRTRSTLGDIPILILEPFLTPDNITQMIKADVAPIKEIICRLAKQFDATFISLDAPLAKAAEAFPPHGLTHEGVHPTPQGHSIIAKHWLDAALPLI